MYFFIILRLTNQFVLTVIFTGGSKFLDQLSPSSVLRFTPSKTNGVFPSCPSSSSFVTIFVNLHFVFTWDVSSALRRIGSSDLPRHPDPQLGDLGLLHLLPSVSSFHHNLHHLLSWIRTPSVGSSTVLFHRSTLCACFMLCTSSPQAPVVCFFPG